MYHVHGFKLFALGTIFKFGTCFVIVPFYLYVCTYEVNIQICVCASPRQHCVRPTSINVNTNLRRAAVFVCSAGSLIARILIPSIYFELFQDALVASTNSLKLKEPFHSTFSFQVGVIWLNCITHFHIRIHSRNSKERFCSIKGVLWLQN